MCSGLTPWLGPPSDYIIQIQWRFLAAFGQTGMLPSGENAFVLFISTLVRMQLIATSDPRAKNKHPKVFEKVVTIGDLETKKE
jgi:hypothetical protein